MYDCSKVTGYLSAIRAGLGGQIQRHSDSPEWNAVFKNLDLADVSPSTCAWLYYGFKTQSLKANEVRDVLQRDGLRQTYAVGDDIVLQANFIPQPDLEARYRRAREILKMIWPDMSNVIEALNPQFCFPPAHETYESASDPKRFGMTYFRMSRDSVADFARILVHEISHQYLFVVFSHVGSKFKAVWDTPVYSTIRSETRPLIGLLHGVLAQAAMLSFVERARRHPEIWLEVEAGANWIVDRYAAGFLKDYATVKPFGVLGIAPEVENLVESTYSYWQKEIV